jgi:hypothetical protein
MFWASAAYSAELGELPLKGISMTITNTGKEDVVISHFGGYERGAKNGAMLMPPAGFVLPYKLAPRASAPLFWRYTEDMQNWRKLKDFIVFDTLLRRFKSDKDNFKEIKEKIRQEAETKKGK